LAAGKAAAHSLVLAAEEDKLLEALVASVHRVPVAHRGVAVPDRAYRVFRQAEPADNLMQGFVYIRDTVRSASFAVNMLERFADTKASLPVQRSVRPAAWTPASEKRRVIEMKRPLGLPQAPRSRGVRLLTDQLLRSVLRPLETFLLVPVYGRTIRKIVRYRLIRLGNMDTFSC
jgi:hypothetical protein